MQLTQSISKLAHLSDLALFNLIPSVAELGPAQPPYYIKANPKSDIAGLQFLDISCCFVKIG